LGTVSPSVLASGGAIATYRMPNPWQGGYRVDFQLTNPSAAPIQWTIRVQLPANARYDHSWSAEVRVEGTTLIFTPPRWDNGNPRALGPGTEHVFGFIATQPPGDYRLLSCTIDGSPCRAG
jgi:cellulase/cellobiase CelA1